MAQTATAIAVLSAMVALIGSAIIVSLPDDAAPGAADQDEPPPEITIHMANVAYDPKTITVPVGTKVTWVNDDAFAHTVTPTDKGLWGTEGSGDDPADWLPEDATWSFTFTAPGVYDYYCIPHANQVDGVWRGMVATVIVTEDADAPDDADSGPPQALAPDIAEIGRPANSVPPALERTGPASVTINLTAEEVIAEMDDGTSYEYWTFNGQVPGPMLRVRVGDTVTVNLHNLPDSTMGHDVDFHAVTGPGGGAALTKVQPGETATFTFKALNPGLYVYHCAFQNPALHIAHGMYGMILVEPEGGLPPVDKEFYVMQGDFYSSFDAGDEGHHEYDAERAAAEDPSFVVFNGRVGSLTEERALQAEVGDTVRIHFGVGGPNLVSSFHVIGEIFDRVYDQGAISSPPLEDVQTTLVPAGGAVIVEFDVEVPGDYLLVDHSLNRLLKGGLGILHVTGEEAPEVYREGE